MVDAKHAGCAAAAGWEKGEGVVIRTKELFLALACFRVEPSERLQGLAVDRRYIFEQGVAGSNQKVTA
jgi:hypothetical protein